MNNNAKYQQLTFLEFVCSAPNYRIVDSIALRLGADWARLIPSDWYICKNGKISLTHRGWNELVARGNGRVKTTKYITSSVRRGRARYDIDNRDFYWIMPAYLRAGAK